MNKDNEKTTELKSKTTSFAVLLYVSVCGSALLKNSDNLVILFPNTVHSMICSYLKCREYSDYSFILTKFIYGLTLLEKLSGS